MTQCVLPFKYETEDNQSGMTALAGLPIYLELARTVGLSQSICKHLKVREFSQGWNDSQVVISLILLNLAGGDCIDDIKILEADKGFCEVLKKAEMHGLRRKVRRALLHRWRKERTRTVPSASAIFRYLEAFHDEEQEKRRQPGKAFVPAQNEYLRGFAEINKKLAAFSGFKKLEPIATLDQDATLVETTKEDAKFSYKGYKAYQPFNTWWFEQGTILHTEFRDGNVPAGYEQLRVFKEALSCLPKGVEKVRLRSDTAAYQHELLNYCAKGENERFGVIEFAIGCNVTAEFKKAVAEVEASEWKPIYKTVYGQKYKTKAEWAEVCFVPNAHSSKNGPTFRYIAKREAMDSQLQLPGMEAQMEFPFPTMEIKNQKYKVFGIVTNLDWNGEALIHWQHERCGKSEKAHAIMKDDFAGGKLPSENFGENAAWWWIMILAFNLNVMMKDLAMKKKTAAKRMKAIRFSFINLPGRVVRKSRKLIIRLARNHPSFDLLLNARRRIAMLQPIPVG